MKRAAPATLIALAAALILPACDKKPAPPADAPKAAPVAALPADLFIAAAPADAQGVKAAKQAAGPGQKVVVRGRVGGSADPFVDGRAVFTLMDFTLPACSDNPDDACATPWDYCCEKRADITANAATIQVTDASGAPLKVGLKGASGLAPLSEVVVIGTVTQKDDSGVFVVRAEKLHVGPPSKPAPRK
ncbi:MAG: hypothetical protein JNJ48_01465 [Phycisphaerae bacterium]|nr:hypothetical protein [Phycisphaerae bacterium]